MPLYMMQGSYTTEALVRFCKNPDDRGKALEKLISAMGGEIISLYYSMGQDDFVFITDMPDDMTAMSTLLAGIAPGHIKEYRTSKLFTLEQSKDFMRQAGQVLAATSG